MKIIHLSFPEIKQDIKANRLQLLSSDESILLSADSISSVPDEVKYRLLKELFEHRELLQKAYEAGFIDFLCSEDCVCPHCHSKLYRSGTKTKTFIDEYGETVTLKIHKVRCSNDRCSYVREVEPYFSVPGFQRNTEELDQVLISITSDTALPKPKDPEDRKYILRVIDLCMMMLSVLMSSELKALPKHLGFFDTMKWIWNMKKDKSVLKFGRIWCEFTFSAPS